MEIGELRYREAIELPRKAREADGHFFDNVIVATAERAIRRAAATDRKSRRCGRAREQVTPRQGEREREQVDARGLGRRRILNGSARGRGGRLAPLSGAEHAIAERDEEPHSEQEEAGYQHANLDNPPKSRHETRPESAWQKASREDPRETQRKKRGECATAEGRQHEGRRNTPMNERVEPTEDGYEDDHDEGEADALRHGGTRSLALP